MWSSLAAWLFAAAIPSHAAIAAPAYEALEQGFQTPPDSAKPLVWWHWMNGNVTQPGIELDLQWMRRIGIGGVQTFDATVGTPVVVDERLVYMTPPWNAAFRHAVTLADQLGLEFSIAGSPGFSESGGPWVQPEQAMKKLVWSEVLIEGGAPVPLKIPPPPATIGPFQDIAIDYSNPLFGYAPAVPVSEYYQDIAVIAFQRPQADQTPAELHPVVTSSSGTIDEHVLWDGKLTGAVKVPFPKTQEPAWIQQDFGHALTVQSLNLALQRPSGMEFFIDASQVVAELQSSADGKSFTSVVKLFDSPGLEQTVSFAPTTARYFRLSLPTPTISPLIRSLLGTLPQEHRVAEWVLHTTPRVDHFEQKAGFFVDSGLDRPPPAAVAPRDVVDPKTVIDLTAYLRSDGQLDWTPPAGRWVVQRIGYSLLGRTNHPAVPEASGFEVDKLDAAAVGTYMHDYLGRAESIVGRDLIGKRGLRGMVNDSWEAGAQNWTPTLQAEFLQRRGYDLRLWLPALTGRIIGSAPATEAFLWDFRRTLAELVTQNHFGQIASALHARHMIHYSEAHEYGRAFIGDGMDAKRYDDVPMGAMWVGDFRPQAPYDADLRESASVAHIYGQKFVGAESMTAFGTGAETYAYRFSPATLKATADRELLDGVNRFIIHSSVQQPAVDSAPGVAFGPFGQWFMRNETWADMAVPWVNYLSRSSFLLQQGQFVADVLYYYGQDSNITALYGKELPAVPAGYAYDFANDSALTMLFVRQGCLETKSGMRYRLLALDQRARLMSLDVLKRIANLVQAGAVVLGDRPKRSPSLADNDDEFQALADAVWGSADSIEHRYGRGKTLKESLTAALATLEVAPDFKYSTQAIDAKVGYVHRHADKSDIFFVNNREEHAVDIEAHFRVHGKTPRMWRADDDSVSPVSYRMEGRETVVPLKLRAQDAVFLVFGEPTRALKRDVPQPVRETLATVAGPWQVHFQARRGAPESAMFASLQSWSENSDQGIKYFSGVGTYETTVNADAAWLKHSAQLLIDLGAVKNVAQVEVNDKPVAILWKAPFRADVGGTLKPGVNRLRVRVANLWPNRLIGDRQPGATAVAVTTFNPYSAESPLLDSGLLGPVTLIRERRALK